MKKIFLTNIHNAILYISIIGLIILLIIIKQDYSKLNSRLIELETKERVEFYINTYSPLSYQQILNSMGELEVTLISNGIMQDTKSEDYRKLVNEFDSVIMKINKNDIKKIQNYNQLTKPNVMAVVVKSYYNIMSEAENDQYRLTINEFDKYLKGEPDINFDSFYINIDKKNVEGDLLRLFILLQIIKNVGYK